MISDTSFDRSNDQGEDGAIDAIALLETDHLEVKRLFAEYEDLIGDDDSEDERGGLARDICYALTAHATAEEDVFYPAAREVLSDESLIERAYIDHADAKLLIERILAMDPSNLSFDDTVLTLKETIEAHVDEEEAELFPLVQDAGLDLERLGHQIAHRKEEVLARLEDNTA